MDAQIIKYRIRAVRRRLGRSGLDGLIIVGSKNVRYLTGFRGDDSWALVLPRSVVLVTDSRYTEQAFDECTGCKIVERKGPLSRKVAEVLARHKNIRTLGIEDICTAATLSAVRKVLDVKLRPVGGTVEAVRTVKSDDEIRLIKKAARAAFGAMEWTLGRVNIGMTEREVAALYAYRLSVYNATPAFPTIAAFGSNGSRNHHQPGSRKLCKNDMILLDFGANVDGYISDITRCFAVGKPSDLYCAVYEMVAQAQKAAIAAVRAGAKVSAVDAAARQVIRDGGLPPYGHGTGHGIGLEVHESPSLSGLDKRTTLQAGQVVTIEPGVYLPGKFGIRLEDDVRVTRTGAKVLTRNRQFDIDVQTVPIL